MIDIKQLLIPQKDFLVVEMGDFNIKVALFSSANTKIKLENFWLKRVVDFSDQEKETALRELLRDNFTPQELKTVKALFILPERWFIVRRITFPSIPLAEIPTVLQFKLKDEIPFDIEKALSIWNVVGESENAEGVKRIDLLVSVIEKEKVSSILAMAKAAGISCYGIYSSFFSLASLFSSLDPQERIGVLDLGGMNTFFMIFGKNKPLFIRNIPFDSNRLTKIMVSMFKEYALSFEEAEKMKKQYGLLGGEEQMAQGMKPQDIISCMRSDIEKLISEIKKSIEYYTSEIEEVPLSKLYVIGGGAQLKRLQNLLSAQLHIETNILPTPQELEVGERLRKENVTVHMPPLFSVIHERRYNFLPREQRISEFKDIERALLRVGIPFFVLLYFFLFVGGISQIRDYKKRLKYTQMHLGTVEEIRALRNEMVEKGRIMEALKRSFIPGDWILKSIAAHLPPEMIVSKMSIDEEQRVVSLQGYLPAISNAEEILTEYSIALSEDEIFEDVNIAHIAKAQENTRNVLAFRLNCRLIGF